VRSRNIKPGFFQNEVLPELSAHTRLLFIGLWCLCDWEGRMELRPKRILMSIFPYEQHLDINQMLLELHNTGFITMYGDGKYLQVNNFLKHQHPIQKERDKPSSIPDQSQFDPGSILDRSKIDPSMIPVGLIPDVLKPDVMIPDVLIPDPRKEKKEHDNHLSENKQHIIDVYNSFASKNPKWAKCSKIPSGEAGKLLDGRAREPEWIAAFPEQMTKAIEMLWITKGTLTMMLRPDHQRKILDGEWGKDPYGGKTFEQKRDLYQAPEGYDGPFA